MIQVARDYGAEWADLDSELVVKWEEKMAELLKAKSHEEMTSSSSRRLQYQSPLNARLWDAWQRAAKDPDNSILEFIQHGVPLGMETPIPTSNGVFPKVRDLDAGEVEAAQEFEALRGLQNYVSVTDQVEEAETEIKRYEDKGFVKRLPWSQVTTMLGSHGTVSKLALIIKEKEDKTIKRRIVIDLRRSKGNERSVVDERLILPRVCDVLRKAQKMKQEEDILQKQALDRGDRGEIETEIYLIDLKDAFCHFAVRESEQPHCVSPGTKEGEALLWVALLFGFKSAPLLMARLSSALGRMLASMVNSWECFVQIYVDDILLMVSGSRPHREGILSMVLHTLRALGVMLSLNKGERGSRVTWIGTVIEVNQDVMQFSIPEKMVKEVLTEVKNWPGRGMVSLKSVRTITGKLSWIAGIPAEAEVGAQYLLQRDGRCRARPKRWQRSRAGIQKKRLQAQGRLGSCPASWCGTGVDHKGFGGDGVKEFDQTGIAAADLHRAGHHFRCLPIRRGSPAGVPVHGGPTGGYLGSNGSSGDQRGGGDAWGGLWRVVLTSSHGDVCSAPSLETMAG